MDAWMSKQMHLTALTQRMVLSVFRGRIPLFQVYNLSSSGAVQPTGMRRHDECRVWPQTGPSVFPMVIITT